VGSIPTASSIDFLKKCLNIKAFEGILFLPFYGFGRCPDTFRTKAFAPFSSEVVK
jgi:hypothetical protein